LIFAQQITVGIIARIGSSECNTKALMIGIIPAKRHDIAINCLPNHLPKSTMVVRLLLALSSSKSLILLITNKLLVNKPQAMALRTISQFSVNVCT
jgi:hypothetical protein